MLQWETVDPNATYPSERYKAGTGEHEYRIFHDLEERHGADLNWVLGIRRVREGDVPTHLFLHPYRTIEEAKLSAEHWEGPPPLLGWRPDCAPRD